jgi:hypothetical protein
MKIINIISKSTKANDNIMIDNQKDFRNIEELNLKNRLKINNKNHKCGINYSTLEKSNSLGSSNNFRTNSLLRINNSSNLDIYPLDNIHQKTMDNHTYTRNINNYCNSQIINNYSFLHHNASQNKFISHSSDKNYLNRINLSNEINIENDFYKKEKVKDKENEHLNNNIIKKYLANNRKEGCIKKILSINSFNNKNMNNFKRSHTNLLDEKKKICNYLNYSDNIKSRQIKEDKNNYYDTFNNIQNTNNSTLKNSVLHKKYNIKYNKAHHITDVNFLTSGLCNNINLNQTYILNNSNLKEKEKVLRKNNTLLKSFVKSKITSGDLNRNMKIKINPLTAQTNPKNNTIFFKKNN